MSPRFALTAFLCISVETFSAFAGYAGEPPAKTPAAQPKSESQAAAPVSPTFLPSKHGFAFRNSFSGSPLPKPLRGFGIETAVGAPSKYGKCGGMSLAAADLFYSGTAPPAHTVPPAEDSPLFDYITQRQTDSLGAMGVMAATFARFMVAPDTSDTSPSAASLTVPEIAPILARLDKGELVPLGLVYVGIGGKSAGMLWDNHQVLAFKSKANGDGWNGTKERDSTDIHIYDPNFPRDDRVVIRVSKIAAKAGAPEMVKCEETSGTGRKIKVRGLFIMPYEKRLPPTDLSGDKPGFPPKKSTAASPPPAISSPDSVPR